MSDLAYFESLGEVKTATNMLLAVLREIKSQGIKIDVQPTSFGEGVLFQLSKRNWAANKDVKLAFRLSDKIDVKDRRVEE